MEIVKIMKKYSISKTTKYTFEDALQKTKAALAVQGFGVLTEINVKDTLKSKLNVDYNEYVIIGACNPKKAYAAMQTEKEIGLLLPCNVIVYNEGEGVVVSAISPTVAMGIIENPELLKIANDVEDLLEKVIEEI